MSKRYAIAWLVAFVCGNTTCLAVEHVSVETWVAELKGSNPQRRVSAAQMLGGLRSEAKSAVPELINALADHRQTEEILIPGPNPLVSTYASEALVKIGEPAVPALVEALSTEKSDGTLRSVIVTLKQIGNPAAAALPALKRVAVESASPNLRAAALDAWGAIQRPGPEYVRFVAEAINDKSPHVRSLAAQLLGSLGNEAAPAVDALTRLLDDEGNRLVYDAPDLARERPVRFDAAEALGLLGPAAKSAGGPLKRLMVSDNDIEVRVAAALALVRIDENDAAAMDYLVAALANDAQGTAGPTEAARSLAQLGPRASGSLTALAKCLDHDDLVLRLESINAIAAIGGPSAIAILQPALQDEDEYVRAEVAAAVKKLQTGR